MKIAYLILCHKNSDQINKLIGQLDDENCCFFVHIDKKTVNMKINMKDNIFLVPESSRVNVQWASISMVEATLKLIGCALKSKMNFDYFFLISGQDFPIKNNSYIRNFLEDNKGMNFIEVIDHCNPLYIRYKKRNDIYYPKWMFSRKIAVKIIRKIYIYMTGGYSKTLKIFKRQYPADIQFEYGSQWWCLTFETIKWIYEYLIDYKGLDYFVNSMTPDECVFQTTFMMSPYHHNRLDRLVFLIWNKAMNNPITLRLDNLNILLDDNEYLFARKFDINDDSKIVDALVNVLKQEY